MQSTLEKIEDSTPASIPANSQELTGRPEFHITDERGANWYLRKIANLEAEKARVRAQAAQIVAALDADAARLKHLYGAELEAWARQQIEARGGRRKSLPLLQGTLAFRTVPASLKVADEAAALEWCASAPAQARALGCIREELDAAAYREAAEKALKETGELLPGIEQSEARESFAVRFGKDAGDIYAAQALQD